MRTLKDRNGLDWYVSITAGTVQRLRAAANFDVNGVLADGLESLGQLVSDPCRLVEALFVVCRSQAQERGIDLDRFMDLFEGDSLEAAGRAFSEAVADFFPNARTREDLMRVIEAGRKVAEKATQLASQHVSQALEKFDVETEAGKLIASSTSAPASSE